MIADSGGKRQVVREPGLVDTARERKGRVSGMMGVTTPGSDVKLRVPTGPQFNRLKEGFST